MRHSCEPEEEEDEEEAESGSSSPPNKRRNDSSCALADLFGETFSLPKKKDSLVSLNDQAGDEMRKYKEADPLALTGNPLCWWREHQAAFPLLSNLARSILCIPGTSVAAERVFSTAGDIVTAQRSSLRSEHVDQLLFLHKNMSMY